MCEAVHMWARLAAAAAASGLPRNPTARPPAEWRGRMRAGTPSGSRRRATRTPRTSTSLRTNAMNQPKSSSQATASTMPTDKRQASVTTATTLAPCIQDRRLRRWRARCMPRAQCMPVCHVCVVRCADLCRGSRTCAVAASPTRRRRRTAGSALRGCDNAHCSALEGTAGYSSTRCY